MTAYLLDQGYCQRFSGNLHKTLAAEKTKKLPLLDLQVQRKMVLESLRDNPVSLHEKTASCYFLNSSIEVVNLLLLL